jgi:hypothetical protein
MPDTRTPGQVCYEAYARSRHDGTVVLPWANLRPDMWLAWDAAALAVLAWEDVRQKHQEDTHA